jgi:large subunit ribosomal protein L18
MKLDKKRRLKYKTNYNKRLKLLEGRSLRLVVRKTNKYIISQIIESKNSKDFVKYSSNSKDLLKLGWPKEKGGSLKSIAAGYLCGYLLGKKAKGLKERLILDSGLIPNTKGSRIYSVVKGIIDCGLDINCSKKVIPSEERIKGKDTKINEQTFNKIKENIK